MTKHLWLKPHPYWASMNPACFEAWGKPEAHRGCSADTCPWVAAQTGPILDVYGLTDVEQAEIRDACVDSIELVSVWADPPSVIPWDSGGGSFEGPRLDQDHRWYTSLLVPADVLRAGAVTLCGKLGPSNEEDIAVRQSDVTCLDCLHKLEIDKEMSLCPVVPFEHEYLACRAPLSVAPHQRHVGSECRRCSGEQAAQRLVSR